MLPRPSGEGGATAAMGAAQRAGHWPRGTVGRALLVASALASLLLLVNALLLLLRANGCSAAAGASSGPVPPPGLPGAQFSPSLGCWQTTFYSSKLPPRLHVVSPLEGADVRGPRWEAVREALYDSAAANDRLHWVIVTSDAAVPAAAAAPLAALSHDIWFCPELLLSTLLAVGNDYVAPKLLISPDTRLPVVPACRFTSTRGHRVAYVIARSEPPFNTGCWPAAEAGLLDGIMYEHQPDAVLRSLRFAWNYAGAVNVALQAMQDAGFKLANVCPYVEFRRISEWGGEAALFNRTQALRINDPQSSLRGGRVVSAETFWNRLCLPP